MVRREISSVWGQGDEQWGWREADGLERVLESVSAHLAMYWVWEARERRCKNDSQVSGLSNWVDGDNL